MTDINQKELLDYLKKDYKAGKDFKKFSREKIKDIILKLPDRLYICLMVFIYPNRTDYPRYNELMKSLYSYLAYYDRSYSRKKACKMIIDILIDE